MENPSFLSNEKKSVVQQIRSRSVPARSLIPNNELSAPRKLGERNIKMLPVDYDISFRSEPEYVIHRLIFLAYLPSGFWSRLLTRLLGDDSVVEIIRSYFIIPREVEKDDHLGMIIRNYKPEWLCWQTGLELQYFDTTLFSVKEVLPLSITSSNYHQMNMILAPGFLLLKSSQLSLLDHLTISDLFLLWRFGFYFFSERR